MIELARKRDWARDMEHWHAMQSCRCGEHGVSLRSCRCGRWASFIPLKSMKLDYYRARYGNRS